MNFKRLTISLKLASKGQSFVELSMVLLILLTLLTGLIEFGNLLNQYINVVDAAREGARFASNDDPFIRDTLPFGVRADFFTNLDIIIEGAEAGRRVPPDKSRGALSPLRLQPDAGDDVVISFFSIHDGTLLRFPNTDNGWSYYKSLGFAGQNSLFSTSRLESMIPDSTAPDTGMVMVEIFYHYNQILKFWSILGLPDPIEVHTYAIMPLSAAEPTPSPP